MFSNPTKKFDSTFLSNYYNYTNKLVCLWNGRLNCWSLYIRTGFSWSLYIQTNFLQSLYIMTEMTAVRIYIDWFRIQTITHTYIAPKKIHTKKACHFILMLQPYSDLWKLIFQNEPSFYKIYPTMKEYSKKSNNSFLDRKH